MLWFVFFLTPAKIRVYLFLKKMSFYPSYPSYAYEFLSLIGKKALSSILCFIHKRSRPEVCKGKGDNDDR